MKILMVCSRYFYKKIPPIKEKLEREGHEITLPNSYEEPFKEESMKKLGQEEHIKFKQRMMRLHEPKIKENDAILVLNFEKNGIPNYLGGGTFMEIVKAWELNKKIFFFNEIPNNIFTEELIGINPVIINGDLTKLNPQIEIEIRSFISKEQYEKLLEFFTQNAELIKKDFQETHYFNCPQDLRIQKSDSHSKIWLKAGKIHDDAREETELIIKKEDFEKAQKIFNNLGLKTEIKWLRNRTQFKCNEIKICLDYTKGYGYIIELEKIGTNENKEQILIELKQKLNELGISLTSKEVFQEKFNYYKNNWKELIK